MEVIDSDNSGCYIFLFQGATRKLRTRRLHCGSLQIRHTHTRTKEFLRTNDQLVAEAATYKTHNHHKTQTHMPSMGFEPAVPAIERLQNYTLDRTDTGIGFITLTVFVFSESLFCGTKFVNSNVGQNGLIDETSTVCLGLKAIIGTTRYKRLDINDATLKYH